MCFAEIVAWQPPDAGSRPVPIGSRFIGVSLQPAIPRRVAPQQSPLPLHQSRTILKEKSRFEKEKSLNGMCSNRSLSQRKGSPQQTVDENVAA